MRPFRAEEVGKRARRVQHVGQEPRAEQLHDGTSTHDTSRAVPNANQRDRTSMLRPHRGQLRYGTTRCESDLEPVLTTIPGSPGPRPADPPRLAAWLDSRATAVRQSPRAL